MRIVLYRLVDGSPADKSVLRNTSGYKEIATRSIADAEVLLLIKDSSTGQAKWAKQLADLAVSTADLAGLTVASSSALLLAKVDEVTYAICFGNGYQAINPAHYVRGFGMRVTANAIAGTKIKSVDTRGLNREGRSQKVILPVESELAALGIEPSEEWVRQLRGTVTAGDFASTAEGADSLKLSIKDFGLVDLGSKLREVEKFWKSTDYKAEFGFLDNFGKLDSNDPLVAQLDAQVAAQVLAGDREIYFAAPDPFEKLPAETYRLLYRKKIEFDELDQDQVFGALDQLTVPQDDPLRKVNIEAINADGGTIDRSPLYEYIQAEVKLSGSRYVLSAGVWFRVSDDYVKQVSDYLKTIDEITATMQLPAWPKKSSSDKYLDEGDYNKQAAAAMGFAVLDKDNLQLGQHQKIEICDLLSTSRELICVKRAAKSATLSHLFAQGNVSSSLMHEADYQAKVLEAMQEINGPTSWGSPNDWTIVFAIGTPKPGLLADTLFFFSQVQLMAAAKDIRSRNIKVAVARIVQ